MANQADLPVRAMCRVLGVSASGFYAWRERAPSQRSIANAVMTERIRQIHQDSYESYGMPRVRAELIEQGVSISRQRVARLMRQAGIHGISKRRGFTVTTRRDKRQAPAGDLVNWSSPHLTDTFTEKKGAPMGKTKPPYPEAFKQQIVELFHSGRSQSELAREFDVSAVSIANWVARAAADAGKPLSGKDVLTTSEREELVRLRREVKRLQTERDILAKATAWFAGQSEKTSTPSTR